MKNPDEVALTNVANRLKMQEFLSDNFVRNACEKANNKELDWRYSSCKRLRFCLEGDNKISLDSTTVAEFLKKYPPGSWHWVGFGKRSKGWFSQYLKLFGLIPNEVDVLSDDAKKVLDLLGGK